MDVVKKVIKADGPLGTYIIWLGGCMRLNDVRIQVCTLAWRRHCGGALASGTPGVSSFMIVFQTFLVERRVLRLHLPSPGITP